MSTCPKCNTMFQDNGKLKRHLDRKKPCDAPKPVHMCHLCKKVFANKANMEKHISLNCPMNIDAILERKKKEQDQDSIEVLETIASKLKKPTSHQQTNINYGYIHEQHNIQEQHIHHHNNTFVVLPFGCENIDHIDKDYVLELYNETRMYNAIPKMIKDIHLNKQIPENMNFFLKNQSKGIMEYKYDTNEWKEASTKEVTEELITDKGQLIQKFFAKHGKQLNSDQVKNYKDLQSNLSINKDYKKFLRNTILDLFSASTKFMEAVVKMDETKQAGMMKEILEEYKQKICIFEKIIDSNLKHSTSSTSSLSS
jgi:Zinc finger, C2H2 type